MVDGWMLSSNIVIHYSHLLTIEGNMVVDGMELSTIMFKRLFVINAQSFETQHS